MTRPLATAEPPLARDTVDVWLVRPSEIPEDQVQAYDALMSESERSKCDRFVFEDGKRTCRITRALQRTTLARYCNRPPESFRFDITENERPYLSPGQLDATPSFNLSHTHDLIACAISLAGDVGVDVEWRGRRTQTERVADRFFSRTELADLETLPRVAQRQRFFDYWTLKEAYLKARGFGLSVPLGHFSFHLGTEPDSPKNPACTFRPSLEPSWAPWWFQLEHPTDEHTLAVAVCRRDAARPLTLRMAWVIPTV